VLAQVDTQSPIKRFGLAVIKGQKLTNVSISARLKALSGYHQITRSASRAALPR